VSLLISQFFKQPLKYLPWCWQYFFWCSYYEST